MDKKQKILRPDEMPAHVANLPHSSHSLSHNSVITAVPAHLMPVFYDYLNAGEVVDISIPFELITEPLLSYARAKIAVHVEYFFVPFELIYQPFGDWYYNIKSQYSSWFSSNNISVLPLLNFASAQSFIGSNVSNSGYSIGSAVECFGRRAVRLFDLLDYPTNAVFGGYDKETDPSSEYSVFPYGLLAYNCIYQYFYRLDNREGFNNRTFNVDSSYQMSSIQWSDGDRFNAFGIKYRPLDNDYFTDCKVSPIVDVLNLDNKSELAVADSWLTRSSRISSSSSFPILSSGSVGNSSAGPLSGSSIDPLQNVQTNFGFRTSSASSPNINGVDINTANLRAMFASEKLWSITGRAKKHYDDQTLAHFGFKVPHDPKHQISRFGHDVTNVDIGMVIATGASEDTPLGEIAGKGRANGSSNSHRFTAPCHGIVMAIMSIAPSINYYDYRAKYTVLRSREDLFTPEYDHLGMQPVFGYEFGYPADTNNTDASVIGWQYRYEQFKRRFNKVSYAFIPGSSRSQWTVSRTPLQVSSDLFGPNKPYSYQAFLHRPDELNQIFVPQYSVNWSTSFANYNNSSPLYDLDQFVIDLHINCSLRSTMSDYSLPRLDA